MEKLEVVFYDLLNDFVKKTHITPETEKNKAKRYRAEYMSREERL